MALLFSASMRARRQEFLALAAALGLHVLALLLVRVAMGGRVASHVLPASSPGAELEVDVELGEGAARDSSNAFELGDGNGEIAGRKLGRTSRAPRSTEVESLTREAEDSAELGEPALETPAEEGSSNRPIDLGIGADGWQRWVTAPKAGERPRERSGQRANRFQVYRAPPVSTSGGLQEGLEAHDRSLGLGPSGRVMTALHKAAHQTVAPSVGTARFDVTVLRTGAVEVALGSASGEVEQWKKVAAYVASELRASPPRIAPPRDGVRLVVELVAEETMPNGTKIRSLEKPHIEATPPRLRTTERSVEAFENDNPTAAKDPAPTNLPPVQLDLPGVYLAERGKVCSYRLGMSVLGPIFQGGCDPTHIGATPQRMVHTRVIEQTMF